jgi:gas vesicle protein
MATSKLMEAAAEILSGSKGKAAAMPPEKLGGEVQDLGGPTPQNAKPDDDSHKIDATKGAKSAAAPTTKPSDASPDTQLKMKKEESEEAKEEEVIAEEQVEEKLDLSEDINALFADDSTISGEFKSKVATIFEARVADRVSQIEEQIEAKYADMLEEAVNTIQADLTEKIDDYLNYVVDQWMEDNQIAIESSLRAEITEEFISGLRNLFAEHYIDVPSEKVDLVDELAGKVEELEGKLNEEIERGVELNKQLVESRKTEIIHTVCEGLTATQVEKIKSLAESVEFSTEEEYKEKLETIRENYFPSGVKKADESQLNEKIEEVEGEKKVIADPFVAAVSQAISKTKI